MFSTINTRNRNNTISYLNLKVDQGLRKKLVQIYGRNINISMTEGHGLNTILSMEKYKAKIFSSLKHGQNKRLYGDIKMIILTNSRS